MIAAGALFIVTAIILWPIFGNQSSGLKLKFDTAGMEHLGDAPVMKSPRLYGVDAQNQPYTVNAEEAIQQDEEHVLLKRVKAQITLADQSWFKAHATEGVMQIKAKILTLQAGVEITDNTGYTLITPTAELNISHRIATGNEAVTIRGPMGHLTAERFNINQYDNVIHFSGNVRVTIVR